MTGRSLYGMLTQAHGAIVAILWASGCQQVYALQQYGQLMNGPLVCPTMSVPNSLWSHLGTRCAIPSRLCAR